MSIRILDLLGDETLPTPLATQRVITEPEPEQVYTRGRHLLTETLDIPDFKVQYTPQGLTSVIDHRDSERPGYRTTYYTNRFDIKVIVQREMLNDMRHGTSMYYLILTDIHGIERKHLWKIETWQRNTLHGPYQEFYFDHVDNRDYLSEHKYKTGQYINGLKEGQWHIYGHHDIDKILHQTRPILYSRYYSDEKIKSLLVENSNAVAEFWYENGLLNGPWKSRTVASNYIKTVESYYVDDRKYGFEYTINYNTDGIANSIEECLWVNNDDIFRFEMSNNAEEEENHIYIRYKNKHDSLLYLHSRRKSKFKYFEDEEVFEKYEDNYNILINEHGHFIPVRVNPEMYLTIKENLVY